MTAVAILAGSLGPCFTDAIRSDELSTVRTISVLLRAHLARDLDSTTAVSPSADPLLALQLRGFVISAYRSLNEVFVAATLNEFTMQQESMSSYIYFLGNEPEKIAVEVACKACYSSMTSKSPLPACIAFVHLCEFAFACALIQLPFVARGRTLACATATA